MTINYVSGESVDDLARAFREFTSSRGSDGMVHLAVELEPEVGAPLRRALMRVEADLLREDADRVSAQHPTEERTDEQRRADALVELTRQLSESVRRMTTTKRIPRSM